MRMVKGGRWFCRIRWIDGSDEMGLGLRSGWNGGLACCIIVLVLVLVLLGL